jgi:hypothetical protein
MAGKGNNNSIGFLELIFQATISASYATLALNATSSPATNLYVSLHTADPGAAGSQTTSEAAYTGYGRVAVARTSGGWSISSETISNVGAVTFGTSSSGPESETYVGIGLASSGGGTLLYSGALTATLVVNNGITPSFAAGQLTVTES